MTPEIAAYCRKWSHAMDEITAEQDRMAYFQSHLPGLLLDHVCVKKILENMSKGRPWPDLKDPGLFAHEVLLYLDPGRRFSLRIYLHPPNDHTEIHDHTSWGISGCPVGSLSIITYQANRQATDNRVVLTKREPVILKPGQVTVTLPWDRGIHQTGSPDEVPSIMISVYGRPGRRLYVNTYDLQSGEVTRRYPPKLLRRRLAKDALHSFVKLSNR